jgi:signal peptidase I
LNKTQKSPATKTTTVSRRSRSGFREWAEFIGTLFLMVFFIRVTTVEAFRIPTGSMENTLLVGDFLLVNKFVYGIKTPEWLGIPFTDIGFDVPSYRFPAPQKVHSGDVIVFKYPLNREQNYIKRCIATPGQTLEIRDREIYLDGKLMELPPHAKYLTPHPVAPGIRERGIFAPRGANWNHDNYGPITIPEGKYFMMGDNRDNSHDSRYWGFVDEDDIVGKALIIYFSFDKYTSLDEFYDFVRWSRIGNWIH